MASLLPLMACTEILYNVSHYSRLALPSYMSTMKILKLMGHQMARNLAVKGRSPMVLAKGGARVAPSDLCSASYCCRH